MNKGIESQPFADVISTPLEGGKPRAVAFNEEHARMFFNARVAPIVLCVDGNICRWVETAADARNFFNPPTKYECQECGYKAIGWVDTKDISVCPNDGSIMSGENPDALRKQLAKHLFND